VSTIVLTHYHMDHAGSVKNLKDLTNAKVAVEVEDADFVAGNKPYPKPKNPLMRAASSLIKVTPVNVDVTLKDGDSVGTLKVIHTPGHTPASIVLLDEQRGVLFAGDTLRFEGGKITGAPKHFTWDATKERESIKKIAGLRFDVMLPGHGELLTTDASKAVGKFAGSL
jgi:glyoxylase-like metal-dependent hydrolase (beta-lactamase superfamily II)